MYIVISNQRLRQVNDNKHYNKRELNFGKNMFRSHRA